ncbi:MAG: hypothetical protein ACYCZI_01670 [Metallibacterium scheffleri]|jgi:hypothetical protein
MPKRKILASLLPPDGDAAGLAAIKEALKHPHYLTADEERDFIARRGHATIERHEYIATKRRGKIVYREPGKAGADLPVPPYYYRMLVAHRDFETECAKVDRELRLQYWPICQAQQGQQTAAQKRAERIRALAQTVPHKHGRIKAIARAVGVDVRTVRRILNG